MSEQLSKKQIQALIDFTEQKQVKYEDVKYEIVDHLASDIEAQMQENPKLKFETALYYAYGKFPITGFAQFINQKEESLKKYWNRKMLHLIKSYFTIPKLLLTLFLFLTCMSLKIWFPEINLEFMGAIASCIVVLISSVQIATISKSKNHKRYLFQQTYVKALSGFCVLPGYFFFMRIDSFRPVYPEITEANIYLAITVCLLITLQLVFLIALVQGEFKALLNDEFEMKYQHLQYSE